METPGTGNTLRGIGPFHRDIPHPERGVLHNHVNCGKRSVTLDLESGAGRRMMLGLTKDADVIIEDWGPGAIEARGLGYGILGEVNPDLVMVSLSNFGRKGPYKHYKASELISSGLSGPLYISGALDREPVKAGGRIVQFQAGVVAALLTMVAVRFAGPIGSWQPC